MLWIFVLRGLRCHLVPSRRGLMWLRQMQLLIRFCTSHVCVCVSLNWTRNWRCSLKCEIRNGTFLLMQNWINSHVSQQKLGSQSNVRSRVSQNWFQGTNRRAFRNFYKGERRFGEQNVACLFSSIVFSRRLDVIWIRKSENIVNLFTA